MQEECTITVWIVVLFTFSVTIGTHRLHLLDHPRGQLSDHDAHATPPTCCTFLYGARLASLPAHTQRQGFTVRNHITEGLNTRQQINVTTANVPITSATQNILAKL